MVVREEAADLDEEAHVNAIEEPDYNSAQAQQARALELDKQLDARFGPLPFRVTGPASFGSLSQALKPSEVLKVREMTTLDVMLVNERLRKPWTLAEKLIGRAIESELVGCSVSDIGRYYKAAGWNVDWVQGEGLTFYLPPS
jgi:hypothetical protein